MPNKPKKAAPLIPILASHRIWGQLSGKSLESLAAQFTLENFKANGLIRAQRQLATHLGLIISGGVQLSDPDLRLSVRLGASDMLGFGATPERQLPTWQASAIGECDVAWLAPAALQQVCQMHPALAYFFPSLAPETALVNAQDSGGDVAMTLNLLSTPIRSLIKRGPVTLPPDTSIQVTAALMRDLGVSSMLLADHNHLFGLVTDRDLRNRVVAEGLDIRGPASDIATMAPTTVSINSPAFEALLMLARNGIEHMPVMDGRNVVGMITATDLTEQRSTSPVCLVGEIYQQDTLQGLVQISGRVKQLQQHLATADASAHSICHIVTAVIDALTIRLIQLAEGQLGPAPINYLWVSVDSQARREQTTNSDQDNCLILSDGFDEARHGAYFSAFSKFVCDGLNACGYIHCPGGMMAMTDIWRQPRKVWADYFRKWIEQPKPKALMRTCVFFDLRGIHGSFELLDTLQQQVLVHTEGNSLFLAHMVNNALKHRPPLGLFGQISLIKGGANAHTIDLKHSGIVPIVDLARIYTLAVGLSVPNTQDRLEVAFQAGEISQQSARDLRDALEFFGKLRIAHQARQIRRGKAPDNFLALEELSNFERGHLKDAFAVIQTQQGVLHQRYLSGRS
ncbi:MAG TPA: putative nucleotidyltransferase substrate binding domain-containing protein [Rhodoferax sp.]|nr:putative nucleotidyltransferase substrate binding domain-containing protein [Rhodoferax sp.]